MIVEQLGGDTQRFRELWTAARLAEREGGHRITALRQYDFLMVNYYLPGHIMDHGSVHAVLLDYANARNGAWLGASREAGQDACHIALSDEEHELHYVGYCKSTLWPLYHDVMAGTDRPSSPSFEDESSAWPGT